MPIDISSGGRVLFIGDSVTDGGRSRTDPGDLGRSYAYLAAALYTLDNPGAGFQFLNRGISGDRVRDLRARWDADCLELEPSVVSILVGINDTWRRFDSGDPTPAADYERDYRNILERTRNHLDARLVLIEPFLVEVRPDQREWRKDLDPRIEIVRELAAQFGAMHVAADKAMRQAAAATRAQVWCEDGVHPTPAGHALLARAWLRAVDLRPLVA